MKRTFLLLLAIAAGALLGNGNLCAATFVVTNNADSGPGSLRQAILDANAGGGGKIDLTGVSGTITVTTNLPAISTSVSIVGPGTNALTVSGSNTWVLFTFQPGTINTMANLAVANGFAEFTGPPSSNYFASGVKNLGILDMQNCLINHCQNIGTDGGGIYNSGALELDNCVISDCGSYGEIGEVTGGGVYNSGLLNMNGCKIVNCFADDGGGIYSSGTAALTRCQITTCGADEIGSGGGIVSGGQLVLIACVVTDNFGNYYGGGIEAGGTLIMANTTVAKNSALQGGGMDIRGTVWCVNCSISGNYSYEEEEFCGGGGIRSAANLTMLNCTVSSNRCYIGIQYEGGGGIENLNQLTMSNCTVSGNTSVADFSSLTSHGAGILNGTNAVTYLTDCTVVSNSAATAMGVENVAGTVYAEDSIIANNNGSDFSGTLVSQGYNLIGNTNACVLTGDLTGNIYGVDPLLGPLQNNGGPTFTHALLAGSPAIDAGPVNAFPFFDQRGAPRPFGPADDIGAFEFGATPRHVAWLGTFRNGLPRLNIAGVPGFLYMVERAPSPSGPWMPLSSITADLNGGGVCQDTNAPSDHAFYRVVDP
jgi:hypothetical protein